MIYLSLMVSETPIVPTLSHNQKVHAWAQVYVQDQFDKFTAIQMMSYLMPLAEVMTQDLGITSTPQPASADEPSDGAPPKDDSQ